MPRIAAGMLLAGLLAANTMAAETTVEDEGCVRTERVVVETTPATSRQGTGRGCFTDFGPGYIGAPNNVCVGCPEGPYRLAGGVCEKVVSRCAEYQKGCEFVALRDEIRKAHRTINLYLPGYRSLEERIRKFDEDTRVELNAKFTDPTHNIATLIHSNDWNSSIKSAAEMLEGILWVAGSAAPAVELPVAAAIGAFLSEAKDGLSKLADVAAGIETKTMSAEEAFKVFMDIDRYRQATVGKLYNLQRRYYCKLLWPSAKLLRELTGAEGESRIQQAQHCTAKQRELLRQLVTNGPLLINHWQYHWGGPTPRPEDRC